jgi:cytochrome c553
MKKLVLAYSFALIALGLVQAGHAQAVEGNAAKGQEKVAQCGGCHGMEDFKGSFPQVYRVPKIAGQNAKYLAAALTAYQKGERKHPTMRGVAAAMNAQDIADVAAYYEAEGAKGHPKSEAAPSSNAGLALIEKGACKSCHGADLSKGIDPSYPKLAGQYSDYLFAALKSYKIEGSSVAGRSNAIMAGMVKQFSNDELKSIAKSIASMPGSLAVVPEPEFRK